MSDARRAQSRRPKARAPTHDPATATRSSAAAALGFVPTPHSEPALRALVDPHRGAPALDLPTALALTQGRHGVDFTRARARAGIARGHLIDIILELPGGRGNADEQAAADTLLGLVLGEARFADWVGQVSVLPAPRGGALNVVQTRPEKGLFFPLADLATIITAAVTGIHGGLASVPLCALGGEQRWFLFELDPDPRAENSAQSDVVLVSTFMPELLKCYLSGAPFASTRFSRHGELFAYFQYENRERDPRRALAQRRVLEDALDAALVTELAGRVIGSGMGIVYSYVNLALHRVAQALDVVHEVAAKVGVAAPKSGIRFCDTALEQP